MKFFPTDLIESLEFDLICQQVSERCVTSRGRHQILQSKPTSDFQELQFALWQVNEVLSVYQTERTFPGISEFDIRESLKRLRVKNAVLDADQFMAIKSVVESYQDIYRFTNNLPDLLPNFWQLLVSFPPNKLIPALIDKVFERNGLVRSNASVDLGKIRSELAKKRQSADRVFYRALKKAQSAGILGEFGESVYENRRVLAVQAGFKGRVNGIFHGSSSKNSIVFVEPGECIQINNEVEILIDDEKREIRRILRQLTLDVAEYRDELNQFSRILGRVDAIHAKAYYAFQNECVLPEMVDEPIVKLKDAINPVLKFYNAQKGKSVIPLSLQLDEAKRVLVISGPNAGGKSITLKTVGLLQLMHQSAFLVPVNPKSKLGIFTSLLGDIGDHQSIENELSTYSSKLSKMRSFLKYANSKTLFLIDEFGSGSDPELGASLAQVFLEELNLRKSLGVITTHYNSIKAQAGELDGTLNGSMLFNKQNFQPEYILQMDTPGSSYTFEVALRSGISKELVNRAKAKLDERTVAIDKLLVDIQHQKKQIKATRERTKRELHELKNLKKQHELTIKSLEGKLKKQSEINEEQSKVLMWGKRFDSLVKAWMEAPKSADRKEVIGRFVEMLKARSGERGRAIKKEEKVRSAKQEALIKTLIQEPVEVGDKVRLLDNMKVGEVLGMKKDHFEISFGNLRTLVPREKFIKANHKLKGR